MMQHLICGPSGSGKSTLLQSHVADFAQTFGDASTLVLRPPFDLLITSLLAKLALPEATLERIDDARGFEILTLAAQPILDLTWDAFADGLNPEVAGLRSPDRFLAQAYGLIIKLQQSLIDPQQFLDICLRGATAFYGNPPNFAHAPLLMGTPDKYRDSLNVDHTELSRQHKNEVALARILSKLYTDFLDELALQKLTTRHTSMIAVLSHLRRNTDAFTTIFPNIQAVCIDDLQNCTQAEIELIPLIRSKADLVLAGDKASSLARFRGARPEAALAIIPPSTTTSQRFRQASQLQAARLSTQEDEADTIALWAQRQRDAGIPLRDIALVLRSMERAEAFERAFIARGLPAQLIGAWNPFTHRDALDAIAALHFAVRPERSDWMLRFLASPVLALSDASLALLCGVPQSQMELLSSPNASASRDLLRLERLARNVINGDRDGELSEVARERIVSMRSRRASWLNQHLPPAQLARLVWSEALARANSPAAEATQQFTLANLFAQLDVFVENNPAADLEDFLDETQRLLDDVFTRNDVAAREGAIQIRSIDSITGLEFTAVAIANAKAGSFPRWYVPDAFFFSPQLGIIPRDNVGDAKAARTAKCTYYLQKNKTRERYNDQERQAFEYALSRATTSVLVTASGRPTLGKTAPEFCEEFRARPGVLEFRV